MSFQSKKLLFIGLLFTFMFITGCNNQATVNTPVEKEPVPQVEETVEVFNGLTEILAAANEVLTAPTQHITAEEVYEKIVLQKDPNYQIIDIRDSVAFSHGYIEGAINIPYNMTANQMKINQLPLDKTIVVVCFSGHTASQTAALWSMLGYDAIPMLNGMGGWTSNKDLGAPIAEKAFDYPVDTIQLTTAATNSLPALPEADSLRVSLTIGTKAYFETENPAVKSAKVVYESMIQVEDPSVTLVDIRLQTDYNKGHLPGAINIPFDNFANEEALKALDPTKTIILIDYNGHTASKATRILSILGYEAYAMKDGMRVWTSDSEINGIAPISTEKIGEFPTKELNVKLDGESDGAASCS